MTKQYALSIFCLVSLCFTQTVAHFPHPYRPPQPQAQFFSSPSLQQPSLPVPLWQQPRFLVAGGAAALFLITAFYYKWHIKLWRSMRQSSKPATPDSSASSASQVPLHQPATMTPTTPPTTPSSILLTEPPPLPQRQTTRPPLPEKSEETLSDVAFPALQKLQDDLEGAVFPEDFLTPFDHIKSPEDVYKAIFPYVQKNSFFLTSLSQHSDHATSKPQHTELKRKVQEFWTMLSKRRTSVKSLTQEQQKALTSLNEIIPKKMTTRDGDFVKSTIHVEQTFPMLHQYLKTAQNFGDFELNIITKASSISLQEWRDITSMRNHYKKEEREISSTIQKNLETIWHQWHTLHCIENIERRNGGTRAVRYS